MIAGLSGDGGKTLVALGVTAALARRRKRVAVFKKGPDYIDAAWLSAASGSPCTNLDSFLMDDATIAAAFARRCIGADLAVIEGNRGLFDGMTADGAHSSAELAKRLSVPVLLVVNATKATRTLAALVLGCRNLDPDLDLAGVILNQVAGERHLAVAKEAIERTTGVPVLGAIPKLDGAHRIPGRHLGLVPVDEYQGLTSALDYAAEVIERYVDLDGVIKRMLDAPELAYDPLFLDDAPARVAARVGVLKDGAFSFYYPENLEALQHAGAEVIPIHSMQAERLPDLDALYIGGGFPETHAERLTGNAGLRKSIADATDAGLPVFAECGGLMYLSRAIVWQGERFPMCGVLPLDVEMSAKPVGHGYARLKIDKPNPFFETGAELVGHEFHYSSIVANSGDEIQLCAQTMRGVGCGSGRDGLTVNQVLAQYTHLHALSSPSWAQGMLKAARRYRQRWDCGRSEE
jgi:cobyrinic acid a,c-diamide synthase